MVIDETNAPGLPAAFGPYRVLNQAGTGVLGPVFRALDPVHDRLIAVTWINLDIDPEQVTRLVVALKGVIDRPVAHRSAVNVIAAGMEDGRVYFATDYVAGEWLDRGLRHLAPMPLDRAVDLLRSLAEVIDAAWEAGVGHGALHPRDVLLNDDGLSVRVTGIGIALALHQAGVKAPVRTAYSAPERSDGRTWSAAADVYSIGAIAHELLTGCRLDVAEQEGALAALTLHDRATVHRILAKATAADPTERFQSARAFVDALEAVAVAAVPVPPPQPVTTEPPLAPSDVGLTPELHAGDLGEYHPALAPSTPLADFELQRPPSVPPPRVRPRVRVASPMVRPPSAPRAARFRWSAIAAVAIAAWLISLAGGYAIGLRFVDAPAVPSDPTETWVRVAPESPAAPPEPIAPPVATTLGKTVEPPANSTIPPRGALSGSWILTSRIEQSNVAGFQDLTLRFRLQLNQDGNQLSGQGLKWEENGRPIPSRGRTRIAVTGTMEGNTVVLSFTERGTRRTSRGRLVLQLTDDGVLDGRFSSDAGQSTGHARAVRVSSS